MALYFAYASTRIFGALSLPSLLIMNFPVLVCGKIFKGWSSLLPCCSRVLFDCFIFQQSNVDSFSSLMGIYCECI